LALAAIRDFITEHGERPTADSWTAAAMKPCERTIRNRFGSFKGSARLDATAISALVGAAKPDPRMFGHALQLLGLQPGRSRLAASPRRLNQSA